MATITSKLVPDTPKAQEVKFNGFQPGSTNMVSIGLTTGEVISVRGTHMHVLEEIEDAVRKGKFFIHKIMSGRTRSTEISIAVRHIIAVFNEVTVADALPQMGEAIQIIPFPAVATEGKPE